MPAETAATKSAPFRPLSKTEIDRQIESVFVEVIGPPATCDDVPEPESLRPRWIDPAVLVRRMRKFIVYN